MFKKALIIVAFLTAGVTGLLADDWIGTFWGDARGEWKGTIYADQDPIIFKGTWVNDAGEEGALYAEGEIIGSDYVFEKGDAYNSDGVLVGHWSGKFPIWTDAYVTGPWEGLHGESGKWGGYRP